MNGNSRLYRSTSQSMLGGVAAGLANYFKIDPTLVRVLFLFFMLATGGGFFVVYLALWLLIPTAGSTATEPNQIIHENVNDMSNRFRSLVGGRGVGAASPTNGGQAPSTGGNPASAAGAAGETPTYSQQQLAQPGPAAAGSHQGLNPNVLIIVGIFFLLMNMGIFRVVHWGMWWPLLLIGLGVMVLSRRR